MIQQIGLDGEGEGCLDDDEVYQVVLDFFGWYVMVLYIRRSYVLVWYRMVLMI